MTTIFVERNDFIYNLYTVVSFYGIVVYSKKMKIIGCQFNKISGPDATSSYKIEFTVDETQREGVLELAKKLKKGSELLLMIFNINSDNEEIKELITEDEEQTRKRFYKRMHALINTISKDKNIESGEIKKILKKYLIQKKYIRISTKELDIKGLAASIFYLQNEF